MVEIAAQLDQPLGNPVFIPDGRLFVTHHPMFETLVRVSEVAEGALRPFPDAGWNNTKLPPNMRLDAVLGIRSDPNGVVWMLDMGSRGDIPPKFVGWDTRTNRLAAILPITPSALGRHSEPNDFVLDSRNGTAYIADEGVGRDGDGSEGALIVVNFKTGRSRRVLEGSHSTRAEKLPILVDGREMVKRAKDGSSSPMRVGCDGIALDDRSEWLYYGPLSGSAVYRLRVADLLDGTLSSTELTRRVERHADRPVAGGITVDRADNLYFTEVGARAIGVIPAEGRHYRRLAEHPDMLWPDGLTFGPDGMLYATVAQLPLAAPLNGGTRGDKQPHLLVRTRPLAPGRVG
ncbi:MAG: SMP-30/gluconolactonase/LRE family protein [Janthinobacterium lividum]